MSRDNDGGSGRTIWFRDEIDDVRAELAVAKANWGPRIHRAEEETCIMDREFYFRRGCAMQPMGPLTCLGVKRAVDKANCAESQGPIPI